MNPANWFEIPVTDIDRAEKFYQSVLDLKLNRQPEQGGYTMSWFPMERDAAGATGTLMHGEGYTPSHEGSIVYFSVKNIDDTLAKINDNGGKTVLPKKDIGEYGLIAWFEDTEGNRVALHQDK